MRIAVYGASGYTGTLVAAEVHKRGEKLALVGRNPDRLRAAATQAGIADAEIRHAEVSDLGGLTAAFADCDAVINCAGPFTLFGVPVVRAAIAAGCHYVDTSAEQLFVKRVFDEAHRDAQRAGVTVVPAAGFDIVAGDVLAHVTGRAVEPVRELRLGCSTTALDMTRGTMHSMLEIFRAMTSDLSKDFGSQRVWRSGGRA
jgi:short subunit dehydrogenase-like uncharacterized protein